MLPTVVSAPSHAYLRQITRTNNASVVAPGAVKPTSVLTLERVEGRLRVVASLSEAVDSYWLSDNASLGRGRLEPQARLSTIDRC